MLTARLVLVQRRASLANPQILEDDMWTLRGNNEGSQTLQLAINNVGAMQNNTIPDWGIDGAPEGLSLKSEPLLEGWLSLGFSTY